MKSLAKAGAALLGGELRRTHSLGGGCLSQIAHIYLTDGREAIVKSGPAPQTEAAMLKAIAASGAPALAVLAVSGEVLVLEVMPAGGSLSGAWADLGSVAARLHSAKGQSLWLGGRLRFRSRRHRQRLGWTAGRSSGRSEGCSRIAATSLQLWPGAWRRSPRTFRTGCRRTHRPPCFTATCGAGTSLPRTAE